MPTIDDLKRLGIEVRSYREAQGKTLTEFAKKIEISYQMLSQIERGFASKTRGPIVPSDETIAKLAKGLGVPVSRLHGLLGRLPDQPYPAFSDPNAARLAERYLQLPQPERETVLELVSSIEALVDKRHRAAS